MNTRSVPLLMVLLLVGATPAMATTIDFMDPTIPGQGDTGFSTQGFTFSFFPEPIPYPPAYIAMQPGLATCPGCNLAMESAIGELFSLSSVSVWSFEDPTMVVTGFFSGGSSQSVNIQLTGTAQAFDINWDNLVRVEFDNLGDVPTAYTSIVASQVPIPAAVWLFGSALGVLGWARRRATLSAAA